MSEQYFKKMSHKGAYKPQIMKDFPVPPSKKNQQKNRFETIYVPKTSKKPFGESDILNRPEPESLLKNESTTFDTENIPPLPPNEDNEVVKQKPNLENIPLSDDDEDTAVKTQDHLPKINRNYDKLKIAQELVCQMIETAMEAATFSFNAMVHLDMNKSNQIETTTMNPRPLFPVQRNGHLDVDQNLPPSGAMQLNKYNSLIEVPTDDGLEEIEEDILVEKNDSSSKRPEIRQNDISTMDEIQSIKEPYHLQSIEKFKEHLDRAEKIEPEDKEQDLALLKAELRKSKPFKDDSEDLKHIISKGRNSCLALIEEKCSIF